MKKLEAGITWVKLPEDQKAILIFDVFKDQITDKFTPP